MLCCESHSLAIFSFSSVLVPPSLRALSSFNGGRDSSYLKNKTVTGFPKFLFIENEVFDPTFGFVFDKADGSSRYCFLFFYTSEEKIF